MPQQTRARANSVTPGGEVRTCSFHFVIVKHSLLLSHLTLPFLRYKNNAENTSSCPMWVCAGVRVCLLALTGRRLCIVPACCYCCCCDVLIQVLRWHVFLFPVHCFSVAFFDSVLKIHLAAIRRQLLCLDATFIKCFMVLNIKLYMDK